MEITAQAIIFLFFVAIVAGWVDAVAGGGGLIALPAMLLTGMPPAAAIATNKLQGSFGTFTAAFYFLNKGVISIKENIHVLFAVFIGSVFGGFVLTQINTTYLSFIVPILLLLVGFYYLFFARDLDASRQPKISDTSYNAAVAPSLGFYDGFFGPGTGTFYTTSLVALKGIPIREATANAKLLNFTSNLAALIYFVFFGQIIWLAGIVMIGGQIIGAFLGAKVALDVGAKIIRPMTILMCFAMSLAILWKLVSAG